MSTSEFIDPAMARARALLAISETLNSLALKYDPPLVQEAIRDWVRYWKSVFGDVDDRFLEDQMMDLIQYAEVTGMEDAAQWVREKWEPGVL